jgi:propionyl-CoA carboxylase alpha chain
LHLGGVRTNRDALAATLRSAHFLRGDTTTDFLERAKPSLELELSDDELHWAATAGALWLQGDHRMNAPVLAHVPSGWRNARLPRQLTSLRHGERRFEVHYRSLRDGSFDLADQGSARIHMWHENSLDVEINGRRRCARVTHDHDRLYVQVARGTLEFTVEPRFAPRHVDLTPGGLSAPMPGLVLDVKITRGEHVDAGATLVVMEAMKMEHVIVAPYAGTVREVLVATHQQVASGEELLALEPDTSAVVEPS